MRRLSVNNFYCKYFTTDDCGLLYYSQDDRSEKWRLQAVAVGLDKFDSRKPLPLSWRGLNDDELSQVSGIIGCTFVHISGFIGGNRTYDGALAMAKASLMLT